MTIEDKARNYALKVSPYEVYPAALFYKAYLAGATEALASQWVSIKNALPKEGETVIGAVFDDDGELYQLWCVAFYGRKIDGLHFWTVIEGDRKPISHWMRIPARERRRP